MKRLLAIIAATALLFGFAPHPPAYAAEALICGIPVKGKILTTATTAVGGDSSMIWESLGCPVGPETLARTNSQNSYHTHFRADSGEETIVFWSSLAGGKWWNLDQDKPNVGGVANDRDALSRYGYKGGMLMRSAKLDSISSLGKQRLVAMMHGGVVLNLRDTGAADPNFPDVSEIRTGIPGHASGYSRYVTGSKERSGISKAIKVIASSGSAPVWVHCAAGRDRTGVVVSLVLSLLGADQAVIKKEYLRTSSASGSNLDQFFSAVSSRYGSGASGVIKYLKSIGVTDSDMSNIRTKFLVK